MYTLKCVPTGYTPLRAIFFIAHFVCDERNCVATHLSPSITADHDELDLELISRRFGPDQDQIVS